MAYRRYPRPNHRIAPSVLRDLLDEPIPGYLIRETRFPGTRLADLDETAWDHFSQDAIGQLARLVISCVSKGIFRGEGWRIQLPPVAPEVRLKDLTLETRTRNCLMHAGFAGSMNRLGWMNVNDLMRIPAFGPRCLIDFLTALEAPDDPRNKIDPALIDRVVRFAEPPEIAAIQFDDPRLGPLLRSMDTESGTVADFVERIRNSEGGLPSSAELAERLDRLAERINALHELTVEEEFTDIFSLLAKERDLQILAVYYNWGGSGSRTLEQLARKHGLSRERIRQICARLLERVGRQPVFAPVLDRTLRFLADRLPRATATLERELREAGLSRHGLSIAVIEKSAGFFSRTPPFRVLPVSGGAVAVAPHEAALPSRIIQAAKSAVGSFGVATAPEVKAELTKYRPRRRVSRELFQETLSQVQDFQWLDARRLWFCLNTAPVYGLQHLIEKVVSVARCIDVSRLHDALDRYRRRSDRMPPPRVLREYCRQMPTVRVEGNTVYAEPTLDWRSVLAGVERTMVEIFMESGPIMERGEFEEECVQRGVNRFSFNAILTCSPVVTHYGRSVYGLVAQQCDSETVQRVRARSVDTVSGRILQKCGVDEQGRPFAVYRLSKAAIACGVITIPASLKQRIAGEYTIVVPKHEKVGTLVAKRGCGWGLGPVLRAQRARPGDYLLLQFDNVARTAGFHLGDERLLEPSLSGP